MIPPLTYHWVSTCEGNCFIRGRVGEGGGGGGGEGGREVRRDGLRSVDSGTHSCYVVDSVGNSGMASISFTVTGKVCVCVCECVCLCECVCVCVSVCECV